MRYLLRLLDRTDPTASLRQAAYAAVIAASLIWLTYGIHHEGITVNWVAAFVALLGAVGWVKASKVGASVPPAPGAAVPETIQTGGAQ